MDSEAKWQTAQAAIQLAFPPDGPAQPSEACTAIAYALVDIMVTEGAEHINAGRVANVVADTIEADFEVYMAIFQEYLTR
jgi:hypothetical protein